MLFCVPGTGDFEKYRQFLECDEMTCENSFLNAIMWGKEFCYEYGFSNGSLVIRVSENQKHYYFLPLGGDFCSAVREIEDVENGEPQFIASDGQRLELFKNFFSDKYVFDEQRDNFEYIYCTEKLITLSGKKYHTKRNHIAAFSRNYNWHYEKISASNIEDVRKLACLWTDEHAQDDEGLHFEHDSILSVLDSYDRLGVVGGIIYVEDKPAAFTFGTKLNDNVFDVNIEKALTEYPGAYTVINNEFVKNELKLYKYVNREDDLGIEGLRKSKLSYHPEILLKRYICTIKKDLI